MFEPLFVLQQAQVCGSDEQTPVQEPEQEQDFWGLLAGAVVYPDPSFLKQLDYFRIFIQDFHHIDMYRSRIHLYLNP